MTQPIIEPARLRDAFLGLCYLAVVAAVALGAWLAYDQTFVDRSEVTLTTGTWATPSRWAPTSSCVACRSAPSAPSRPARAAPS